MIKANDLRIGNYILCENGEYPLHEFNNTLTLVSVRTGEKSITHFRTGTELFRIPITEEWLLKFGFKGHDPFYINDFGIMRDGEAWTIAMRKVRVDWRDYGVNRVTCFYEMPKQIQFVHQLQNLYYALTGEELTIKQEAETA